MMDKHQTFAFGLEETCSMGVKNIGIGVRQIVVGFQVLPLSSLVTLG